MDKNISECVIIGSGPAGYTAAIYLSRAMIKHKLISGPQPGGQLTITTDVENYPGFADPILGPQLMDQMMLQAKKHGTTIVNDWIESVEINSQNRITLKTNNEEKIFCKTLIIATGASAKWLDLPSIQEYRGYGVSACATCDGFFFKGQNVIVIGGGNTAAEEAIYLSKLCKKVTIIYRGDKLRAEAILVKRILDIKNIQIVYNSELKELIGDKNPKKIDSAKIINNKTNIITQLDCDGCFIAIGHQPNTKFLKNKIELDEYGYVVVDYPFGVKTSAPGIFAAGDVHDKIYRQAVTAAGSGCMAAIEVINYLKN